jgi:hypothetical protein
MMLVWTTVASVFAPKGRNEFFPGLVATEAGIINCIPIAPAVIVVATANLRAIWERHFPPSTFADCFGIHT